MTIVELRMYVGWMCDGNSSDLDSGPNLHTLFLVILCLSGTILNLDLPGNHST